VWVWVLLLLLCVYVWWSVERTSVFTPSLTNWRISFFATTPSHTQYNSLSQGIHTHRARTHAHAHARMTLHVWGLCRFFDSNQDAVAYVKSLADDEDDNVTLSGRSLARTCQPLRIIIIIITATTTTHGHSFSLTSVVNTTPSSSLTLTHLSHPTVSVK